MKSVRGIFSKSVSHLLRQQAKLITRVHQGVDVCLTVAAFIAAYFVRIHFFSRPFDGPSTTHDYKLTVLMIVIIWASVLAEFNLYSSYRKQRYTQVFWQMFKSVFIGMMILIFCMYLFKIANLNRILLGIFFIIDICLLGASKGLAYCILAQYRKRGFNFRNILIIGCRKRAMDVIDAIGNHAEAGYHVLGCLDIDKESVGRTVKNGVRVIGTIDQLQSILCENVVDELIIAMPTNKIDKAGNYIALVENMGVMVRVVPDWQLMGIGYLPKIALPTFEFFFDTPTLSLNTTPNNRSEILIKSFIDYVCSAFGLICLLPLFLFIAVCIRLSSKGPVFFKQERCGLNGRRFNIYKFRTMVEGAEDLRDELLVMNETDGPVFKIRKDPRIIPFLGTLLRKSGLDELPQLINILKGEMSLIGPRPPIPEEVEQYDIWQRRRLSMKPGLTCLWQCTPNRNDVSFEDWMKIDLQYIDTWSLLLDFKIILKTTQVMIVGSGR